MKQAEFALVPEPALDLEIPCKNPVLFSDMFL